MFVSGPVGTSVTGVGARRDRPGHEVDGVLAERRPAGRRQRRTVEPAVTVDVGCHRELRSSGRSAPAATETSARPARSSTRSAFAVVFSRVWLPCTVVTPSNSSSGLASASSRAIASSCPGSQSMITGMLMRQYRDCGSRRTSGGGSHRPPPRSAGTAALPAATRRAPRPRRPGAATPRCRAPRAARRAGTR